MLPLKDIIRSPLAKVFSLFLVGIILPTSFLVYLGIQSIRAETLLLRKESQERSGKTAQALQEQSQQLVNEFLQPYAHAAEVLTDSPGNSALAESIQPLLRGPGETPSLVLAVGPDQKLIYPVADARQRTVPIWRPLPTEIQAEIVRAEDLEFQKHAYDSAAKIYSDLETRMEPPAWRAMLLTRRAGCLAKGGHYDAAERDYQEILSRYWQESDPQGNPYGLIIRSQLGDLQQQRGRMALAASAYLGVWQDLLSGRWGISWEERQFFIRHLRSRLDTVTVDLSGTEQARIQSARQKWDHLAVSVEEAHQFIQREWPALARRAREQDKSGVPFLFLSGSEMSGLVYVPVYDPGSNLLRGTLVARVSARSLQHRLQTQLDDLTSASGLVYRLQVGAWPVWGDSGREPAGKRWPFTFHLARIDPEPLLLVAPLNDLPVERAAARRRRVYLAMVCLAALVILIALYATWYAISREVEVAQLKARFVASMSHELKTPLSIIGLVGQKLQLGRYESQDEAQEYYAMLAEETTRLKSLIDDVLDFSRLLENRQPYRKERVDLRTLVEQTVERFCQSLKSPDGRIQFVSANGPCWGVADPEALRRVLFNLLDNAVKYSPPDRVRIQVRFEHPDDSQAVLKVQDQGYGIAAEEQALVFDRFYRGKSASAFQSTKGVGLGLSIVDHIIKAHAGRIELQSQPGKGSIFSIILPLNSNGQDSHR